MCRLLCSPQHKRDACVMFFAWFLSPQPLLLLFLYASIWMGSLNCLYGAAQSLSQGLRLLCMIVNPFMASQVGHLLLLSCLGGGQRTCIPAPDPPAPYPAEALV